jgi:hypothetical protein
MSRSDAYRSTRASRCSVSRHLAPTGYCPDPDECHMPHDAKLQAALKAVGRDKTPNTVCTLLIALAATSPAKQHRYDTTLVGAAEMIRTFERIANEH